MWDSVIFDTRKLGAMSEFMDKFVHIVPKRTFGEHWVQLDCWCEPKVTWPKDGVTCVVWHKHKRPPEHAKCYL